MKEEYQYDVAVSFAGEDRCIAEAIAIRLDAEGYSVFYDDFEAAQLWGRDLPVELARVYSKDARFCLIVSSKYYAAKMWPNHERQHAMARFLSSSEGYILPLKVDDTEIPGLASTIGYVSLKRQGLDGVHRLLLQRLGPPMISGPRVRISKNDRLLAISFLRGCNRRAIFTKTYAEIDFSAMKDSIRRCVGDVQEDTLKFKSLVLQNAAHRVMSSLDELDRIVSAPKYSGGCVFLAPRARGDIDKRKLNVIKALHEFRRAANLKVQLPTELAEEQFFKIDDFEHSVVGELKQIEEYGEPTWFSPYEVLRRLDFLHRQSWTARCVSVNVPKSSHECLGHGRVPHVALSCVLDSAIKYCPRGGTVSITFLPGERGKLSVVFGSLAPRLAHEESLIFRRFHRGSLPEVEESHDGADLAFALDSLGHLGTISVCQEGGDDPGLAGLQRTYWSVVYFKSRLNPGQTSRS